MKEVKFDSLINLGDEEDVEVSVTVTFIYDQGVFLEVGHPMNGYGKGFDFNEIIIEKDGEDISDLVSDIEAGKLIDEAKEKL